MPLRQSQVFRPGQIADEGLLLFDEIVRQVVKGDLIEDADQGAQGFITARIGLEQGVPAECQILVLDCTSVAPDLFGDDGQGFACCIGLDAGRGDKGAAGLAAVETGARAVGVALLLAQDQIENSVEGAPELVVHHCCGEEFRIAHRKGEVTGAHLGLLCAREIDEIELRLGRPCQQGRPGHIDIAALPVFFQAAQALAGLAGGDIPRD